MWAIVEIMGHRVRAGMVGDATIGGTTMLRIEHPTAALDGEPLCEYYTAAAIFAIRPCGEDDARQVAANHWLAGPRRQELPPAFEELIEGNELDEDGQSWQ